MRRVTVVGALVGSLLAVVHIPPATAAGETFTWDGGGADDDWTTAANWEGDVAPVGNADETLVFGSGNPTNDFPAGTSFADLVLVGPTALLGNAVVLTGDIVDQFASHGSNLAAVLLDVELAGGGAIEGVAGADLFLGSPGSPARFSADGGTIELEVGAGGRIVLGNGSDIVSDAEGVAGDGTMSVRGDGVVSFSNGITFDGPVTVDGGNLSLGGTSATLAVTVAGGSLRGHATIGSIDATAGVVNPCCEVSFPRGDLRVTDDVVLGAGVTLDQHIEGSVGDRLLVDGLVDLGGAHLQFDEFSYATASTYTLVDNDDNDAIVGTFAGLPEGAVVELPDPVVPPGTPVARRGRISYVGGDGNDVVLEMLPHRIWDGGGGDADWSTPQNWVGDVAPIGDGTETLEFPAGASRPANVNDLVGAQFQGIDLTGSSSVYELGGNPITLDGDITSDDTVAGPGVRLGFDITLAGDTLVSVPPLGGLWFDGVVTIGAGNVLTTNGFFVGFEGALVGGELHVEGPGARLGLLGNLAGPVTADADGLQLFGTDTTADVAVLGDTLVFTDGAGVGRFSTEAGALHLGPAGGVVDTFTVRDGLLVGAGTTVVFDVAAPNDTVDVTGPVEVHGSLQVSALVDLPIGTEVVLIRNDGTDAVTGTFAGLAQDSTFALGSARARVDYAGGDGNDVSLHVVPVPPAGGGGGGPEVLGEAACPPAPFDDVDRGSVHAAAIDCMAALGIATGTGPRTFDPSGTVTRGQLASFLARALDLPAGIDDAFDDDDGDVHEPAIDALAARGIVEGTGPGTFDAGAPVTRAQAATMLRRAAGVPLAAGPDAFDDDDGDLHEADIDAAAAAGLLVGTGPRTFSPADGLRRDQLATLLANLLAGAAG